MNRVYLPYVLGSESPIPYLFKKIIPHMDEKKYTFTVLSNQQQPILDRPNVDEQYYPEHRELLRKGQYVQTALRSHDLVHTGGRPSIHAPLMSLTTARNRGIGHLHTFRVDVAPDSSEPTEKKRELVQRADAVTAVSEHTARTAQKIFDVHPTVIYNGVNPARFTPEAPRPSVFERLDIDGPVFLYVGSLQQRKRPLDVHSVAEAVPETTFLVVGDGEQSSDLREVTADQANTHVLGRLDKATLPAIYAHSTGFLFPSVREGCANVVLEAMAAGTPVIGYKATSMPELIDHGRTGFLAPTGDTQMLAKYVEQLSSAPEQSDSMGREARAYVQEHHDFEKLAAQYEQVYASLLRR